MHKKDLSLLVLILVVGAVVAFINPRFLLVGNLSNTANQVGLFGIFSIAEAFVIIVGGIELSVGSVIALLGVLFIDLIVNHDVNWVAAFAIIIAGGLVIGVVHGTTPQTSVSCRFFLWKAWKVLRGVWTVPSGWTNSRSS